jgi:hypothetical protein
MTKRAISVLILLTITTLMPAAAPMAQVGAGDDWCQREYRNNNDRAVACEVREYTVTAAGTLTVDASPARLP